MRITLTVNGTQHDLTIHPGELLRTALRRLRYFSVKHGDETGESGADAVLLTHTPDEPTSYRLLNSGVMLAAQADGAWIVTVEGLGTGDRGSGIGFAAQSPVPNPRSLLSPLQSQFVACGAIQCGYCTPGMILSAKALLARNPHPTEPEVRAAIAGNLCRCTGYVNIVKAVLDAAEVTA